MRVRQLHSIENCEKRYSHNCIERTMNKGFACIKGNYLPQQGSPHDPVEECVEQIKKETENQSDQWAFNIETHADRGSKVADKRLRDPVHPDRQVGRRK